MKWEYDIVNIPLGINDVKRLLTRLGNEGWEIITIVHQPSLKDKSKATESEFFVYIKKQVKG